MLASDELTQLRPPLLTHALVLGLSPDDAEDLVQDTLVSLVNREPDHLLGYAKQVLVGLLIRQGRRAHRESVSLELLQAVDW